MAVTNVTQAQPGDLVVDFATELTERIADALAAAGVAGVMQYTPYDSTNRFKYGSAKEAKIAHDHGMYYMLNWEIQSDRALGGYPVGRSDGKRNRESVRQIGYPEQVAAPPSVDMDTLLGNIEKVSGFLKGHFETDGDLADVNLSYLDTDGGRALAAKGIDVGLWIPGAFGWSPELYSVRKDRAELMRRASANPQAYCIQFPSEDFQGLLRIDRNIVLKPFNVWCAPREVSVPARPDVVDPVKPTIPTDVTPWETEGEDMASAKLVRNRDDDQIALQLVVADGYTFHGLDAGDVAAVKAGYQTGDEIPVAASTFADIAAKAKN